VRSRSVWPAQAADELRPRARHDRVRSDRLGRIAMRSPATTAVRRAGARRGGGTDPEGRVVLHAVPVLDQHPPLQPEKGRTPRGAEPGRSGAERAGERTIVAPGGLVVRRSAGLGKIVAGGRRSHRWNRTGMQSRSALGRAGSFHPSPDDAAEGVTDSTSRPPRRLARIRRPPRADRGGWMEDSRGRLAKWRTSRKPRG